MAKIWQKDNIKLNSLVEAYTIGNDPELDLELISYDCMASIAHAKMLGKIGILSQTEVAKLKTGLHKIIKLSEQGKFKIKKGDEDGHTAIENFLTEHYGLVGKKIHTGRSRNDQVLVAVRLCSLDKTEKIVRGTQQLIKKINQQVDKYNSTIMPGYTHTQRAMPSTVGMWLGSFSAALADDLELLQAARKIIDQNPLGSVTGFGEDIFGLDREYTTKEMGFKKTQKNPMYCAMSRGKFENIILMALSQIMFDLGKLANDLVWFTTKEFNFFDLPTEFKTGSSAMPQKRNFDLLELIRGNTSIFLGYQFQVQEVVKNLFSGYNRDMQLTKEPYLRGIKLAITTIEIMDLAISNLKVNKENLKLACTDEIYATQKAYQLVKKGTPFRDAYRKVGKQINPN